MILVSSPGDLRREWVFASALDRSLHPRTYASFVGLSPEESSRILEALLASGEHVETTPQAAWLMQTYAGYYSEESLGVNS